jgi:hypothetical protein
MVEFIRDAPPISWILWAGFLALEVVWFSLLVQRGQRNSAAIRQRDAGLPSPPLEFGNGPLIANSIATALLLAGCAFAIFA